MAKMEGKSKFWEKARFRKGNRVLLTKTDVKHVPCEYYPLKGSKFECIGTISLCGSTHCEVHWDNNIRSVVDYEYLDHAIEDKGPRKSDPNVMWKYEGK
jgi:hypothetical protein